MSHVTGFWHTTNSQPNAKGEVKPLLVVRGLNATHVAKVAKRLGEVMSAAYPDMILRVGKYAKVDKRFPEYDTHFYSVVVLRKEVNCTVAERVGNFLRSNYGVVHLAELGLTQGLQEECSSLVVYVPVDVYEQRKALREVLNRNNATVRQLTEYLSRRGFKVPRKSRKSDLLQMVATLEG